MRYLLLFLCLPAYAGWMLSFAPSEGSSVNGCSGYSLWMQRTNELDKNHWDWQGQTTKWDGTNMVLPTSLPSPCLIAVTSDKQLTNGDTVNSFKSEPILFDTNKLNLTRPLMPPVGAVIQWK